MCRQAEQSGEKLLTRLDDLTRERHVQYGETLALLEPNIKNSAGALRDIHTLYYVALLSMHREFPCSEGRTWPSVADMLSSLQLQKQRREQLLLAYSFLLSVRAAMHACSGHLHDTLDFDLQRSVAAQLGYGNETDKRGVEKFMRDYYRHAHTVHLALQLVFSDRRQGQGDSRVDAVREYSQESAAEEIMEVFLASCRERKHVDISLVRIIDVREDMDFSSRICLTLFDDILHERQHVYRTLSRMHEMRILGRIFPEFQALTHFFQHNIYHFFTADEHTLRCIRTCEYLREKEEHVSMVLREIEDISVLYYGLLLHDIAKPLDIQRHEIAGADITDEILRRFCRSDISEDVRFLVREHLSMEQLAFRRNFKDRATLSPFVARVETLPRLQLLYVLTYADMSALNPGVLTEWKKALLAELYEEARMLLLPSGREEEVAGHGNSTVEPVSSMDHHGFQTAVQDILDGELMRMHVTHHRAYSEVTVFCVDRPQLLSRLSAAFFGADTSIVDAVIETRNEVVIDMFRVVDIISGKHLSAEQTRALRSHVRSVCSGELDVEALYRSCRNKWKRRLRKLPKDNVKTAVEYISHTDDDGRQLTIIEVYAPDTFGLLYRLAAEISVFGLNVVFAKIATRVDGVVDSFYIVDAEGKPLVDAGRKDMLRSRLLDRILELTQ
ncbi:MAG: HD domain-containing protein [Bacteroidota bacterium]|nr:HD domain-containing protein [Bacteroidota bacterium]